MKKISAIVPVYNEESLIGPCIRHLEPFVDEIIVVDGGPTGLSTDKTAEIVESFDKTVYVSGTFKTIPGAWDAGSQKNQGISVANGDVFLFISADMFFHNLEFLCETIRKEEDAKAFFCLTIEFWIDADHVRMYAPIENLSIPSLPQEVVAITREASPVAGQHGNLEASPMKPKDQVFVPTSVKYHLGWIRPFEQQIEKHIRHINQGRWGETGSNLLKGTEQRLDQWAILHVLSYKTNPSIELRCQIPEEWEIAKTMNYLTGQDKVINDYKEKYGTTPFRGVK